MGITSEVELKYGTGNVYEAHHAMIKFDQSASSLHSTFMEDPIFAEHNGYREKNLILYLRTSRMSNFLLELLLFGNQQNA